MGNKKLLITVTLFAAMALPAGVVRGQWVQTNGPYGGTIRAFASMETNLFAGTWGGGVYRSTDNGISWIQANQGLTNTYINTLFTVGMNLFAGTIAGVFRSTDNGTNWFEADSGLYQKIINGTDTTYSPPNGSIFFSFGSGIIVGTDTGFYYSDTNGAIWKMDTAIPIRFVAVAHIGTELFGGSMFGVFVSTDSGKSWTQKGNRPEVYSLTAMGMNLFVGAPDGFYRSIDSGTTWMQYYNALGVSHLAALGTNLFANDDWNILRSSDSGASWTILRPQSNIWALTVIDSTIFVGTDADILRSTDSGFTWSVVNDGIKNSDILTLLIRDNNLFAGSRSGFFRSNDGGDSWTTNSEIFPIALSCIGTNLFAGTSNGLFLSSDSGTSWTLFALSLSEVYIQALAVNGTDLYAGIYNNGDTNLSGVYHFDGSNWISAGLNKNSVNALVLLGPYLFASASSGVFRSIDKGNNWISVDMVLRGAGSLAAIGSDLFAGSQNGIIFRSTDSGGSWTQTSTGIPKAHYIFEFSSVGNYIFAGTDSGIFYSKDRGDSWITASQGLSDNFISSIVVNGTSAFIGTGNSGVWRRPLSEFGISSVSQPPVAASSEIHVYPNPFSGPTTVSFTSEASGYAEIYIVNLLGEEVTRLYSGELSAGDHSFTWSNPAMPDGMYECVVRMNGRVQTVAMTILR